MNDDKNNRILNSVDVRDIDVQSNWRSEEYVLLKTVRVTLGDVGRFSLKGAGGNSTEQRGCGDRLGLSCLIIPVRRVIFSRQIHVQ